jgi:hypothetical protein
MFDRDFRPRGDNYTVAERERQSPMEYIYILGTVGAIVGATFCFAALEWPRLFTAAA